MLGYWFALIEAVYRRLAVSIYGSVRVGNPADEEEWYAEIRHRAQGH